MSNVPMNDVPKPSRTYPADLYDAEIESIQEGYTPIKGWLQYNIMYRFANGGVYFERLLCGTEKDPKGTDPMTWTSKNSRERGMGCSDLVDTLRKAKVPGNTVKECITNANGHKLTLSLTVRTQKDTNKDGTPNAYAGKEENKVVARYELGMAKPRNVQVVAATPPISDVD